jgi:hypothetical protein
MAAIIATAVVLGLVILAGLPIALSMRYARFDRQLQHAEKMKALEMGINPETPPPPVEWSPQRLGAAIGVWVPLGVFGATLAFSLSGRLSPEIWYATAGIGIAGIVGSTIVILRAPVQPSPPAQSVPVPRVTPSKVPMDDHAYDTAGSRR